MAEKTYEWRQIPGTKLIKPHCTVDDKPYGWAMEISKDYPATVNKHTRSHHAHPVVYRGLLVQVWKCPTCKDTVVK
jgi:hypothetical protein